jgi:Protein of unknown function (DUF3318)
MGNMHLQRYNSAQEAEAEIGRLMALVPEEMRSQVAIEPAPSVKSGLIAQPTGKQQFCIWINFADWQQFTLDQRNLLFWHEVARVQSRSVHSSSWQQSAIAIGSIALLVELLSQNLVGVVTTLAVTGLGGFQLYQQHWGEQFLRGTAAADQGAMTLAMQFGYSATQAYDSLHSALKTLAKQKSKSAHRKEYQVRLRVLEMIGADSPQLSSPTRPRLSADLPYEVPSLCS